MQNSKIVIFSPGLNVGGIEKVFINYTALLSEAGYNVMFLTCHENADLLNIIPEYIELKNLKTNRLSKSLFQIARFLYKVKPDFIITANSVALIVYLAKCLSFSKTKIIASHHNYINSETRLCFDKSLLFKMYNLCWKVIAVSDGIKDFLLKNGVKPNKIEVINNPINIKEIDSKLGENQIEISSPYIVFVGRLSTVKNLLFLIHSYKKMLLKRHDVKLVIVGEGMERIRIETEIEKFKLKENILLTGVMENPYSIINRASLVVLPSYSEAFPTVLLESLYLGKTIVATPTIGAVDILRQGRLGYLSKSFDDINEFSDLLFKALIYPFQSSFLRENFDALYNPKVAVKKMVYLLSKA